MPEQEEPKTEKTGKLRRSNAHAGTFDVESKALRPFATRTSITPELIAAVCKHIINGVSIKHALLAEGVPESTYHTWKQRAAKGEDKACELIVQAVEIALAKCVVKLTAEAKDNWKTRGATFLLERRFRDEYGPKQEIDINQRGKVTKIVEQTLVPKFIPVDETGRIRTELLEGEQKETT